MSGPLSVNDDDVTDGAMDSVEAGVGLRELQRLVEEALTDGDSRNVTRGLLAITDLKDPSVVPWLIALSETHEAEERATRSLVGSLRRLRDDRSTARLTWLMRAHPDCPTSQGAALALGEIGSSASETALRESLRATSDREREFALRALKYSAAMGFGGGLTREERTILRRDPSARVRWFAWFARAR